MATAEQPRTIAGQDDAAITELDEMVARQRAAFLSDPFPSLEERQGLLGALAGMMVSHRSQIQEALSSDFGGHPPVAADLIEVLGPAGRAVYAAEQLGDWMAREPRPVDPALYGSGRAYVQPQPKGVVGNIVPWNFPFDLSVGPLIEMLAAGNRVVIKPSEYTPACAELLREMVRATFDSDRVDVAVGGLELARVQAVEDPGGAHRPTLTAVSDILIANDRRPVGCARHAHRPRVRRLLRRRGVRARLDLGARRVGAEA